MTIQSKLDVPQQLNGRHQHTYAAIFRHPAAHNLEWHDVKSMLAALGDMTEEANGNFHVAYNGKTIVLHAPKHKDVAGIEELMAIRHFLEKSATPDSAPSIAAGTDYLVVIDHREAKVYRGESRGTAPKQIEPYDPHGFREHLHARIEETDGKRAPERKSFYESIASALKGAERILIFGSGTGESSAMDQLQADLKRCHADLAKRIVGTIVVDDHHRSEAELLAQAREFFASEGH